MEEKSTHGGFRIGAGRKSSIENPKSITFYASEEELKLLDNIAKNNKVKRSEILRALIRQFSQKVKI